MSVPFRPGLILVGPCLVMGGTLVAAVEKPPGPAGSYDVTPRPVPLIPAGTIIDKGPPKGWSHLISKNYKRVGAGDVDKLSAQMKEVSGFLFSAWLANVETEQQGGQARYRLDRVAIGLGTRIGSQDVIITPESQRRLGANLRAMARLALDKGSAKLRHVEKVAGSETLAVIDSPGMLLHEGKHRPAVLRYAILVDGQTGRLETLLWAILRNDAGENQGLVGDIEWLPPNKVLNSVLHVDAKDFGPLGLPRESAFALTRVYQGQKQLPWSAELKALATRSRFSAAEAATLEKQLRALVTPKTGRGE